MNARKRLLPSSLLVFIIVQSLFANESADKSPGQILAAALHKVVSIVEPKAGDAPQTFSARLEVVKAEGLPKKLAGQSLLLGYQAPDRLVISAHIGKEVFMAARDGQQLWGYAPGKKFGVIGESGIARFKDAPEKKDSTRLGRLKLPLPKEQVALLPMLMNVEAKPAERVGDARCHVLLMTSKAEAMQALKLPSGQFKLWVRETDLLPARIGYRDGKGMDVEVQLHDIKLSEPWPAERWTLPERTGDRIETVAVSHLMRFISVALSSLNQKIPSLGPATGDRRVVATEGKGRLEIVDGTRVLFLKGSPQEMGQQHGALLKKEIRSLVGHILYGVGVGSSFVKGRWFFGEIEQAQGRLSPFMEPRYLQEMDALAIVAGLEREEVRLANFFPELFHCSGFALLGNATIGGKMYHGRILDYLKGVGLEQSAVVMVVQPDQGNAWVNVSYAGFIGSVTAMNEKQIAIGEMGGRGEGDWDGKPMAQLMREVMERASTLDEAIAIMRRGPRTCEYYYVISDAKSRQAVGIAATPTKFETVLPGEAHPLLPHPIKDTVLLSANERYEKLVERVKEKYGKFDADSARDLMSRPVAMKSNIHSVLFAPDTLDFWVANADSKNVASHTRYTHYNLADLLRGPLTAPTTAAGPPVPASSSR